MIRRIQVVVKPSPLHGIGIFSMENVPKGTFIDYGDPGNGNNWSNNPNSVPTAKDRQPAVLAIRDIRPGDEITFPHYEGTDDEISKRSYRQALDSTGFHYIKSSIEDPGDVYL